MYFASRPAVPIATSLRTFHLFLCVLSVLQLALPRQAGAQTTERYPFQPLPPPDTLAYAADVQQLHVRCDVLHMEDGSFTLASKPDDDQRRAVLLQRGKTGWLAYPIADAAPRWGYNYVGPVLGDRYIQFTAWSSNVIVGHQVESEEVLLIDPVRARYAAIPIYSYDLHWDPEDASVQEITTADSTTVHLSDAHVVLRHRCTENGKPVACTEENAAYRITPDALVRDTSVRVAATKIEP